MDKIDRSNNISQEVVFWAIVVQACKRLHRWRRSMATSGPGTRPATIYSVAQRAGVSIATVSRVLQGTGATSPQIRANVLHSVEDLEYVPRRSARSLAVQRHDAQGLVVHDLAGPYYSELLMGYESATA